MYLYDLLFIGVCIENNCQLLQLQILAQCNSDWVEEISVIAIWKGVDSGTEFVFFLKFP